MSDVTYFEGFLVGDGTKGRTVNFQDGVTWPESSALSNRALLDPRNVDTHPCEQFADFEANRQSSFRNVSAFLVLNSIIATSGSHHPRQNLPSPSPYDSSKSRNFVLADDFVATFSVSLGLSNQRWLQTTTTWPQASLVISRFNRDLNLSKCPPARTLQSILRDEENSGSHILDGEYSRYHRRNLSSIINAGTTITHIAS